MRIHNFHCWALVGLGLYNLTATAASDDTIVLEQVSTQVSMLSGGGGANISVLAGDGNALMVDAKGPSVAEQIRALVKQVSGGEVTYLINGHAHPDHTDGNAGFGAGGTIIIAHEDVRSTLAAGQRGGPPSPAAALPAITLADGETLTLHFAGETVQVIAAPAAHTEDNLLIFYKNANVLHMGDLFGPIRYPVIAGGTIDGFIAANRMALTLANANTKVIAGIGPLATTVHVEAYLAMLLTVRERVAVLIAQGKSQEEVLAANVTAEFDATWGDPARFVPAVYENLQ
jgi:cyclase